MSNTVWRIVFFLSASGQVMMTNKTTGSWSTPYAVLQDDTAAANSFALDTFSLTYLGRSAVRVYYGSRNGNIREIGFQGDPFPDSFWDGRARSPLSPSSDGLSGVGTTSYNKELHAFVRNRNTGRLDQWMFGYKNTSALEQWSVVASMPDSAPPIAPGSDIAACNDGTGVGTDFIFYQTTNGSLVRALSYSQPASLTDFQVLGEAARGTKLRAMYSDGSLNSIDSDRGAGAVLYYQDAIGKAGLSVLQVDRDGKITNQGSVSG